jgi:hypothetical protein
MVFRLFNGDVLTDERRMRWQNVHKSRVGKKVVVVCVKGHFVRYLGRGRAKVEVSDQITDKLDCLRNGTIPNTSVFTSVLCD